MPFHNNPRIVTRGLIFCADANDGHNASGSDGDNGMVNLVTNTTNARNGTPVVATLGGAKCFHFATASNGHYYETDMIPTADQPTKNATVEMWIYPQTSSTGTERGTLLRLHGNQALYHSWNKSNRKLSNYWYQHGDVGSAGYHETGAAMALDQWHHTAAVWNYDDEKIYQYTNMTKTSASSQGDDRAGGYPEIGFESGDRQYYGGIAFCRVYNVALSDDEIRQNYNAHKSRFGF